MGKSIKLCLVLVSLIFVSACATKSHIDLYDSDHVGSIYKVVKGKVISARVVNIQASQNNEQTAMASYPSDAWEAQSTQETINQITSEHFIPMPSPSIGTEYIIESFSGSFYALIETGQPAFSEGADVLVIFGKAARVVSDPSS